MASETHQAAFDALQAALVQAEQEHAEAVYQSTEITVRLAETSDAVKQIKQAIKYARPVPTKTAKQLADEVNDAVDQDPVYNYAKKR